METYDSQKDRNLLGRMRALLTSKYAAILVAFLIVGGITASIVMADQQTTATPKGIWLSIDEVKKLTTTGEAWNNLKSTADSSFGTAKISDQTSQHNTKTLAAALVYARTGDEFYRKKAAQALMSAVGTEKGGRTLALSWNLAAYVVSADLINLPDYNSADNIKFSSWLRSVRTVNLDGKTLITTHEERPNNWGAGAGASRIAADIYLNDRADLDRAATVFKGWSGDRTAYSGFSYGGLAYQCDPAKPVGVNPDGCKKNGVNIGGALPDDMRRGEDVFNDPPAPTQYPWTALEGAVAQAEMLNRQGYDSYSWSNKAIKRAVQYLYDLSKRADGSWWYQKAAAAWVAWTVNSAYGSNYPTVKNASWGRVMNFTDWTHAKPTSQTNKDTTAPSILSNLKAESLIEKNVKLSWSPSTDNVTVSSYEVSRDGKVLGFVTATSYTDLTAVRDQKYSYKVRAFDAAGNASSTSSIDVTVKSDQGDTTKPVTSISKPTSGSTISTESTPIAFSATDNIGVTKIELYIDTQLEATVSEVKGKTSFSANWNTKSSGNGSHFIEIRAYDAAGNIGVSEKVNITITLPKSNIPTTPTQPNNPSQSIMYVHPSADARVSQDNADKNYGTEDFLRIRDDSKDWESYLKFDISGLTKSPKSVVLRLFANDGSPDAGTLYRVANNWTETAVNWNNGPVLNSRSILTRSTSGSVNDQSWAEFNLTGKVTGNGSYSFGLRSSDDNSAYYSSRESKNKPVLVITR